VRVLCVLGARTVAARTPQGRISPVDSCSCLVTFPPDVAVAVPAALADLSSELLVTSWGDYAGMRCQRTPAAGTDTGVGAGADAAAVVVAKAAAGGDGGACDQPAAAKRAAKRRRAAEADAADGGEGAEQQQQEQSRCSIM
jgi:hypothetical protein